MPKDVNWRSCRCQRIIGDRPRFPSMARPLRIEYPGAYDHLMNRALSRIKVFLEDKDRERFLELLGETSRQLLTISRSTFFCAAR